MGEHVDVAKMDEADEAKELHLHVSHVTLTDRLTGVSISLSLSLSLGDVIPMTNWTRSINFFYKF